MDTYLVRPRIISYLIDFHIFTFTGHGHNFYVQVNISYFSLFRISFLNSTQNIRNNKNHARTPKWAQRYGLVDTSGIKRKERKRLWAGRFNDRLPHSTFEGQPYEEGQEQGSSVDISLEGSNAKARGQPDGDLWRPDDEQFYNPDKSPPSSGRWHYRANFDDAEPVNTGKRGKKKKEKKDRWERTQDAYSQTLEGSPGKKKKKKRKTSEDGSSVAMEGINEFPEDAEGGLYGERSQITDKHEKETEEQDFNHQF